MNSTWRALLRSAFLSCLPILIALTPAEAETLTGKALLTALRSGGYVILMRHASSPRAPPDLKDADPENIHHERQLDERGRSSARAFGEALRRLRIPIGKVLASPTYRALETLKLAGLGPVATFPELGDSGQSMTADNSGVRAAWLTAQVKTRPTSGTNTVIVTHFPNVQEAYGEMANGLSDGEALIFHPDGQGAAPLVGRIGIDEWSRLDVGR